MTGRFSSFLSQDDIREIYATLLVQLLSNDMHKLRSFDPERGNRFGSWIGLLAINAAYDYLRSMRREPNRAPMAEAEVLSCELPSPLEQVEHKIRRIIRWNAAAMVSRANKALDGIGGHLSTYASAASLYEVGFNHFFRGREHQGGGDHIFFQGHAAPGSWKNARLQR